MSQSKKLHSTVVCLQADKVLLVRKDAPEWSLPGGIIDPGETQLEAARRELLEETGLQLTDAQFLGHSVLEWEEHWLYRMNVPTPINLRPSHEIVECRWFSASELEQVTIQPTNAELLRREGFLVAKCSRPQSD
ncbi:NUDIX domain-containing protein [Pseudomonas sp. S37]|uniref:NUDIX domain-containing protein n=1 Tax=Pseudomonas sp. S37 TaxID=2767449 RepID=UPI001913AFF1|nr:NUDIX hydrolase [Pseudomonas sp. S37]MBK4992192.1 NUDIX domain-containing protein [Pseudomonas sp. S37]